MSDASGPEKLTSADTVLDHRRAYLDEVVAELWSGHHVSTDRDAVGESYALVPSGRRPVVMIPRRPRRVAAAVLRNYKASADRRTHLRLRLYSLGARFGLADLLPHRITISSTRPTHSTTANDIGKHLGLALGRDVVLAVYTSPPRANRKTVLQVLTPDGQTFAFVKIGTNDLTRALVRREADALERLANASLVSVEVPQLLHRGTWRGFELLAQRALAGSTNSTMSQSGLADSMMEVAGVNGLISHSAATNPYLDGLRSRMESVTPQPYGSELMSLLDEVVHSAADRMVTLGSWHGDWTPWNMTTDGVKALVWDWERFESDVPLGFDALHYNLQGALVRGGLEPRAAVRDMMGKSEELVAPFGVRPDTAQLTARLYLLELGTRYAQDRQAEAGSRLGLLETWLLPELRSASRATSS